MACPLKILKISIDKTKFVGEYTYLFEKDYKVTHSYLMSRVSHPSYHHSELLFEDMMEVRDAIQRDKELDVRFFAEKYIKFFYERDSFTKSLMERSLESINQYIESNADSVNWNWISRSGIIFKLDYDFIEKFSDEWDWYEVSCFSNMPISFIEKFGDLLDWNAELSANKKIPWKLIDRFADKVYWAGLFCSRQIGDKKLRKYCKHFTEEDWDMLAADVQLTSSFIREYSERISWFEVSGCQKLEEEIISEFRKKIIWSEFDVNPELNPEFRTEMRNKYAVKDK